MVYVVIRMNSCGSYPPKITWTGETATWISRPVTVVCHNVPYLAKWLHEHNSHGMIGIGRLRAGVADPVASWCRRARAQPMRVSVPRLPPIYAGRWPWPKG